MKFLYFCMLSAACLPLVCLHGCHSKAERDEQKTIAGANDRINALEKSIADCEQRLLERNEQVKRLQQENAVLTSSMKETYEEQMRVASDVNRQRVALLEGQVADLRMELSLSEKQRLALEETVNLPEFASSIKQQSFAAERIAYIIIIGFLLATTFFFLREYLYAKRDSRDNIVRAITRIKIMPPRPQGKLE